MSKRSAKKLSDNNARVKVGKLSQRDRELKNGEARSVKGIGGPSGGVLGDKGGEISNRLGR